jgi:succinate dehydrogenase / fumarate reductase cytochrome b subunit
MQGDGRPVFLNLFQIRLPLPGIVSFAHRVSGMLLFLALPLFLFLLMMSLRDEQGYTWVQGLLSAPLFSIVLILIFWSFWHHLLGGVRFLLLDLELGLDKMSSQKTAGLVLVLSIVAAILSLVGVLL